MDAIRQAELYLQDAAMALAEDTPKQAAEALHEVYKAYSSIGYSDEYFMQDRERMIRVAEMAVDAHYLVNPDGSRTSMLRDKLLKAEMELGKESITVH
jgi:hypothetical protein